MRLCHEPHPGKLRSFETEAPFFFLDFFLPMIGHHFFFFFIIFLLGIVIQVRAFTLLETFATVLTALGLFISESALSPYMNDSTEKVFRVRMKRLGNIFFYTGMALFVIDLVLLIAEFESNAQFLYMSFALSALTCFLIGAWIGVLSLQRFLLRLDYLEAEKLKKAPSLA